MSDLQNKIKNLSPEKRALLERKMRERALKKDAINKIQVREDLNSLPLSFAQKRLWFLNQISSNSAFYNMPVALKITGQINIKAMEKSFAKVIERHEILRTVYSQDENGPFQNVLINQFKLIVEEFNTTSELTSFLNSEANKEFDLVKGPLYRIRLLKISSDEHILILTLHHIIADGWSIGIIIKELSIYYEHYCGNNSLQLDKLPIQYFDFSDWQQKYLTKEVKEKELAYWNDKLNGMSQLIDLPLDRNRPVKQTFNGDRFKFNIESNLHEKILVICKELNVTPYIIYLAVFKILLFRITNQKDFGVGTVSIGRESNEVKSLIGFFVNTLVSRVEIKKNQSFIEFVNIVKSELFESLEHQDLPFELIVEKISQEKSLSYSPLFQVLFDYQESPLNNLNLSNLSIELLDQSVNSSKFDLMFIIEDDGQNISGIFEYNTDLFDRNTIKNFSDIFNMLLLNAVNYQNEKIELLSIVSNENKSKLSAILNQNKTDYHKSKSVSQLFFEQTLKNPDAIALEIEDQKLTYSELDKRSNQLAQLLISKGIILESSVGVAIERSFEMIIAILGIVKAGAVYVPLDLNYPKDRIDFMIDDSGISIILSQIKNEDIFTRKDIDIICLDNKAFDFNFEIPILPVPRINPLNMIYVIYTSGSTGLPKGVSSTHQNVTRLVNETNYSEFNSDQVFLQLAPISFDASTLEIWGALLNGGKLVLMPPGKPSLVDIGRKISEYKINYLWLTAGLFHAMVDERLEDLLTVKCLLAGGDILSVDHVERFIEKTKNVLINGYGPTENTTFTACYMINSKTKFLKSIPIGKPISNTTVYILDDNLNQVPVGIPGELYISGDGLARGYLNKPDISANSYIPNPYSFNSGERMYKSGDKVKLLADGNLEFLGRIDRQVKIRGFRIELGEIEHQIKSLSKIKDAVVIVSNEKSSNEKLVAFIICENEIENINVNNIQKELKKSLPEYMIPSNLFIIDEIPITDNGKIDRKALQNEVIQSESNSIATYKKPENKLEDYLFNIWKDVLKTKNFGTKSDFFSIGGNSLQAAVFTNRLRKELNIDIPVQSIFLAPTIEDFANYAREYYKEIINNKFGEDLSGGVSDLKLESFDKITDDQIKKFKNTIKPLTSYPYRNSKKNPKAIFILSPPRSGSTLLRVMLAGHEKLFSPPELDLLSFNSLKERKSTLSGDHSLWLEATVRAIMELKNCDASDAELLMDKYEREGLSVKEFYGRLQEMMGGRIVVDKTPTYGLDIDVLKRAEDYFEDALYIHLIRNPYASIYSFLEAKLDQNFFRYEHSFNRRELAELIWLISHQNILEFADGIPSNRIITLKFEDLVADSEYEMRRLSKFLNIEYKKELVKPYQGKRMTDPVKQNSQMVGDFKFYLRNKIDSNVSQRWKTFHKNDFLCNDSIKLSMRLGYKIKSSNNVKNNELNKFSSISKITRKEPLELSFAQQRLWFLDQLEPGKPTYNIPGVVRLKGKINHDILKKSINLIVDRHESLRSYFITLDGKSSVKIKEMLELDLEVIDYSNNNSNGNEDELKQLINELSRKPFILSEPPLIRCGLIQISNNDNILVITTHHIISDGWSSEIFVKELAEIYDSYIVGRKPLLLEIKSNYIDYAAWQRKWLVGDLYQQQVNYWKNKLSNISQLLELPTDYPRAAIQSQKGKKISFVFDHLWVEKFEKFCANENITMYVLLLTTFNILLKKYSSSSDIIIGTPVAGRNRYEIESLIGLFVNTIVIRNDLSNDPTVRKLLQQVKNSFVDSLNHQDIPYEKLVDELNIERSLSHTPIFQTMFVYNNSPVSSISLNELEIQPQAIDIGISKFDLNLVFTKRNNKLTGVIEYDTELFKEETIKNIISNFNNIIRNLIKNPSWNISLISQPDGEETKKLITEFNKTKKYSYDDNTLHEILEQNVSNYSDTVAVVYKNENITFSELNIKANQLANYLLAEGVISENCVGVCLNRSIESIISILAIWKIGAVYLPLDSSYPKDRIELMVETTNTKYIITESEKLSLLPDSCNKIDLCIIQKKLKEKSGHNVKRTVDSRNLAYIIFTSGSTGVPKGVMVQHNSAVNLACNLKDQIYSEFNNKKMRISLNAALSFDASMQEIVMIIFGHTLVIIPDELRLDGKLLLEYIRDKKIDVLDCVPTQLKILIDSGLTKDVNNFPKIILPGGEAIDTNTWKILRTNQAIKFFNMYGPTECTVDTTISSIRLIDLKPNIGKPINNAPHFILDENFQLTNTGVPGELFIGGSCLSRGYYGNQQLTAARFLPNPFSKIKGERLYKTGDRVRRMPDGNIEYLGRLDNQVKLRGFRIELGEIENSLNNHESIKQSIVLINSDDNSIKCIIAYILNNDNDESNIEQIRTYLLDQLPEYMIPSLFIPIDEIPLLPNGKIDIKALPKPVFSREHLKEKYVKPENKKEEKLKNIIQEILKIEQVGTEDNFFELGGDSILGIQFISKANQQGIQISPKDLFKYPTIKGLAAIAKNSVIVNAEQEILSGKIKLTPIQRWFFEQDFKNPNHWNQSVLLEINEILDTSYLKLTFQKILEHHDALRIKLINTNNDIIQTYSTDKFNNILEIVDLQDITDQEKNIEEISSKTQSSLNIAEGKVIKCVYFILNNKESRLLIVAHHLVIDGVSWRIVIEDIKNIYVQLQQGMRITIPSKTTSFKYWSSKLHTLIKDEGFNSQKKYWSYLNNIQKELINNENIQTYNIEKSAIVCEKNLSIDTTEKLLREVPKKYNTEINDVLLTAVILANSLWKNQRKMSITLEGHGREDLFDDVVITRTIGWFATLFPVVLDLNDSVSRVESLIAIKEQLRKIPNNGIGYGVLKYLADNKNTDSDLPHLSDISFNYLGQFNQADEPEANFKIAKENKGAERNKDNKRPFQIDISCSVVNKKLTTNIIYNSNKYSENEMNEFMNYFISELEKIVDETTKETGGYTPSDFEDVDLAQQDLDSIFTELNED